MTDLERRNEMKAYMIPEFELVEVIDVIATSSLGDPLAPGIGDETDW